jgi:hypothetical protein
MGQRQGFPPVTRLDNFGYGPARVTNPLISFLKESWMVLQQHLAWPIFCLLQDFDKPLVMQFAVFLKAASGLVKNNSVLAVDS